MSIRLRLALYYGALFAVILLLVMLLGYAIHARGQYDDLDRTLVVSAGHAAAEASVSPQGLTSSREEVTLRLLSVSMTPMAFCRRARLALRLSHASTREQYCGHQPVQLTTRLSNSYRHSCRHL